MISLKLRNFRHLFYNLYEIVWGVLRPSINDVSKFHLYTLLYQSSEFD